MKPRRRTLRSAITLTVVSTIAATAAACGAVAVTFKESALLPELVALCAAVCVAIGAGVAVIVARKLTAPLERLAASAASFASGNRQARASVEGPREVRLIAESLNRMSNDVATAIDQLAREERRKTQFVSDVSHELRTPLTAIRGAAETLLDGDVDPDDQERFLSTIASEAERLTRLANDLLQLQRIEGATGELPLTRVDLRLAAERAAAMLEPLLEDRAVTLSIEGQAPQVLGDVDRLQQVVANLVDNASRFVGENGKVTVHLAPEDGLSVMRVTDDGPGIPDEDLPKLFDRFYRSDASRTRSSGGAGLGLAIVRAIVAAHGGTIAASNLPQGGSCFTVSLPSFDHDGDKAR